MEKVDHVIYKFSKFPIPQAKVEKLKSLNGCTRCASLSHLTNKCAFRFKRKCVKCSGWHFSYLCSKSTTQKSTDSQENNSSIVLSNFGNDTMLPTFSFSVIGSECQYRGFKDSGSQSTFISRKLVEMHKLITLQDKVTVTINGFNSPKTYVTKLVEVPIVLGNYNHNVSAVVVPEICKKLELPLLGKVVEGFTSRGYSLADHQLSSHSTWLNNIEFLLGSDFSHCLLGKDVAFGGCRPSMYTETDIGIMLVGNIHYMLKNLSLLSECSDVQPSRNSVTSGTSSHSQSSVCFNTYSFFITNRVNPTLDDEIIELDYGVLQSSCNVSVLDGRGKLIESNLQEATDQILESECQNFINYDKAVYEEQSTEINKQLIDFVIKNLSRGIDGRINVPLLWNGKVSHLLSKNEALARLILKSNLKKLRRNDDHLNLIDQVVKDQLAAGIIAPVYNLEQYKAEHRDYAFLPHMGIFKPDRETTKCRIVFLSNLKEHERGKKLSFSHNQCMHSGPNLNQKLSLALLHLRFDKRILTYDLKKAFNMLSINEHDQSKLLFLWFRNVQMGDFTIVAYRNVRLSFGLRCSPFLLMVSLYKILVLDEENDHKIRELKHLMYSLIYMDNGAISSNDADSLEWAYSKLCGIFSPYQFNIQQIVTNDVALQVKIDEKFGKETPVNNKLLGLTWDRIEDEIFTKPISLDREAKTKRTILKSIATQFDIYGFNMPMMNRSRLFMHRLQCNKSLNWDQIIPQELQREWRNICKQVNASPHVRISRHVGPRCGTFKLIAFTDASHELYGTAIYLYHVESGKISFIQAKNRMVNAQLKNKSIPSLELNAVVLGVETLMELYKDISGSSCMKPINVIEMVLYTDSLCALHWLNASSQKMDKMQKRSTFVVNRIDNIQRLCQYCPVKFGFISGKINPADCVTRCLSYKQLSKTKFFSGPEIPLQAGEEFISFIIPNPLTLVDSACLSSSSSCGILMKNDTNLNLPQTDSCEYVIDPNKYSNFRKLILVYRRVLICIKKWKSKTGLATGDVPNSKINLFAESIRQVISIEQRKHFSGIFMYFQKPVKSNLKDIPNFITQLNVFMDDSGILRVKSKFKKWSSSNGSFPILLPRDSFLTKLLILDVHEKLSHSGCYSVLTEIRRNFYIPRHFSTIKKVLKQCVHCRRFNNRTFRLNQNTYRDFRSDPSYKPFSKIFIDHIGPFNVKKNNETSKVWLLCIACTWTRAINLKICSNLSTKEFLRSFQMHCFEFGIPELCISDLGTQLVAGANIIQTFISDPITQLYFEENNVRPLQFDQYYKGCSQLGSLVEVCVKLVKRLLFGSVKNMILSYSDFEFLVCHTVHLANKRPIAFKESLREANIDSVPEPITPEMIVKGYELTSLNLIPELQDIPVDPDWRPDSNPDHIKDEYAKLRKSRNALITIHHSEFLGTLVGQAVDKNDRYKSVAQKDLKVGDVVLLKEVNTKPNDYPLGMVKELQWNSNNEITGAVVRKGKTNECVKRHITTLILYLACDPDHNNKIARRTNGSPDSNKNSRTRCKAACKADEKIKQILS